MKRPVFIFLCMLCTSLQAENSLTFGTDTIHSLYFPIGGILCQIFSSDNGPSCQADITDGGDQNIEGIDSGLYDLAIIPENIAYRRYIAQKHTPFSDNLRAFFSLGDRSLLLVVPENSAIKSFDDLAGKKVGILAAGTPASETLRELQKFIGWAPDTLEHVIYPSHREAMIDFCEGKVQALAIMEGVDNPLMVLLTGACTFRILDLPKDLVKKLIDARSSLYPVTIPAHAYNNKEPLQTIGTKTIVVVSKGIDAETMKKLMKRLKKHFDYFKSIHITLKNLTFEQAVNRQTGIPRHVGVLEALKGL